MPECRTMSLYRRGDRYYSRIYHQGVTYRKALGVGNFKHAKKLEDDLRLIIAEGKLGISEPEPPKMPTFEEFATDFLNYKCKRRPKSYRTYTKSIMVLKGLPELADCPLDQIRAPLIDQFVQHCTDHEYAIASTNLYLRVLRAMLHFAKRRELITKVPLVEMLSGENKREYVISETDEQQLIDATEKPTLKALIPFLTNTGLRREEACELLWSDIDGNKIRIRDGKSEKAKRVVPLNNAAAKIIEGLRKTALPGVPFVFTRYEGKRGISVEWATGNFIDARRAAGISEDCVLHSTRHTAATRLGKKGVSPFVLQRLFGWADLKMALRYCHVDEDHLVDAMAKTDL